MTAQRDGSLRRDCAPLAGSCRTRAVGPLQAVHLPASGPTAAARHVRRFRFVIADSHRRDVSAKRREAVADYVAEWPGAAIIGESQHGTETIVRVELPHPAAVATVEAFVQECPHYVADTFAGLGWVPGEQKAGKADPRDPAGR